MIHEAHIGEGQAEGYDKLARKCRPAGLRLRTVLLMGADWPRIVYNIRICKELHQICLLLRYQRVLAWSRKKRSPVEIEAQVRLWTDMIAKMCQAHRPEDYDPADFRSEDMLGPMLAAPVAQLREFAEKLAAALEADNRIPYMIWRSYSEMLRESLAKIRPEAAVKLKEKLAREVAAAVEKDLHPQLFDALVGALRWRDAETLKEVKAAVESGEKPTLRGRQSCLFLQAGANGPMVML